MYRFLNTFFQKVFPKIHSSNEGGAGRRGGSCTDTLASAQSPHAGLSHGTWCSVADTAAAPAACLVRCSPRAGCGSEGLPDLTKAAVRRAQVRGGLPSVSPIFLPARCPEVVEVAPGGPSYTPEVGPLLGTGEEARPRSDTARGRHTAGECESQTCPFCFLSLLLSVAQGRSPS